MTGLTAQLLEAIDERLSWARLAKKAATDENGEYVWERMATGCVQIGDEAVQAYHRDSALFIVREDPRSVLRRCAADRRMVERHVALAARPPQPQFVFCRSCTVPWPCPDVLDLAVGYGITPGKENKG